jgi:hypothetical protein
MEERKKVASAVSTCEQERTCEADWIRDTYKEIVERTVKEDKKTRQRIEKWVFCLVECSPLYLVIKKLES